jgi:hypothetical protein
VCVICAFYRNTKDPRYLLGSKKQTKKSILLGSISKRRNVVKKIVRFQIEISDSKSISQNEFNLIPSAIIASTIQNLASTKNSFKNAKQSMKNTAVPIANIIGDNSPASIVQTIPRNIQKISNIGSQNQIPAAIPSRRYRKRIVKTTQECLLDIMSCPPRLANYANQKCIPNLQISQIAANIP